MARGRKKKETVERVIKFTASEFKGSIVEAARLKDQASSYSGFHGEHVKRFTEKTGFSRGAYAFLLKLHRLGDPLKQQSLMDEVVMGFDLLGMNDQGTLFDRVQDRKERDVVDEDQKDLRPPFLQNSIPLDEAEKKFDAANEVAAAKAAVAAKAKKPKEADVFSRIAADPDISTH